MQKSIYAIAASLALATGVDAFRGRSYNSNPFVGEHQEADIIQQENRSTHRVTQVKTSNDKYAAIKSDMNYRSHMSPSDRVYQTFFGETEEEIALKKVAAAHYNKETSQKYGRGRLGDSKSIVENISEDVFAANFVMGGRYSMKGIVDTGTEFVSIQSSECTNCDGYKYSAFNTIVDPLQ